MTDVASQHVQVNRESLEFVFQRQVEERGCHVFAVEFVPDDLSQDDVLENNVFFASVTLQGRDKVLVLTDSEVESDWQGRTAWMVNALQESGMEIDVRDVRTWSIGSLSQLQQYGVIIVESLSCRFNDELLCKYAAWSGTGLVVLGGNSEGHLTQWAGSDLEAALPIDCFDREGFVAAAVFIPVGGFAQSKKWEKVIGREILKTMRPQDEMGVVNRQKWLWEGGIRKVDDKKEKMMARLGQMPGKRDFEPGKSLSKAIDSLKSSKALRKQIVVLGDLSFLNISGSEIRKLKTTDIKFLLISSTRSLNAERLAKQIGGRSYHVSNPKAISRIVEKEMGGIKKQLKAVVFEGATLRTAALPLDHELIDGVNKISYFHLVKSSLKPNAARPTVTDPKTQLPVLASGTHGRARTVVCLAETECIERTPQLLRNMVSFAKRPDAAPVDFEATPSSGRIQVSIPTPVEQARYDCIVVNPDARSYVVPLESEPDGGLAGEVPTRSGRNTVFLSRMRQSRSQQRSVWVAPNESEALDPNLQLLVKLAALRTPSGTNGSVLGAITNSK